MILDTESVAFKIDNKERSVVYNLAFGIFDKKANCIYKRDLLIKEIFFDKSFKSQRYFSQKKYEIYKNKMQNNEIEIGTIEQVKKLFDKVIKYFDIKEVWAFKAKFDKMALNNTIKSNFFSGLDIQLIDLWNIAGQVLMQQKTFLWQNIRSPRGILKTTAERYYQYVSGDMDFKESHLAIEDIMIESKIYARCIANHCKIKKGIENWLDLSMGA